MANKDLTLRDYYKIFKKNIKFIVIFTFIVSVLAIGVTFVLPFWYAGTAQIIRPQSQVLDMSSIQMGSVNLFGSTDGATNRLLTILDSRNLKQKVCEKYDLQMSYETKGMDKTLKEFSENYSAEAGNEGQIYITVFDKDQERVADMANYVVFLLDSINNSLSAEYGKEERAFIEKQLNGVLDSLNILENELLSYMNNNNILSIEDQLRSGVDYATELKYQIMIKETELKVMKQTNQSKAAIKAHVIALDDLKEEYDRLFNSGSDLYIDMTIAPEASLFIQKMGRKIEYFNEVQKFIGPLYEQAKITEAKYISTFEVLDYAQRPDRKAKPKRAIIVIAAFMFAMLSSGIYVLLKEDQD